MDLFTTGQIARRLGVPRARLDYAMQKAGIVERERAGILRLFATDQVQDIKDALAAVATRKGVQPPQLTEPLESQTEQG